jgi:type IV pilus assembly protein PilX
MYSTRLFLVAPAKQRGSVLVVGLVFLAVMTAIVLAVMRSSTLEERMAANSRNAQIALQAAEAMVREAEATAFTGGAPLEPFDDTAFVAGCAKGYCANNTSATTPLWQSVNWSSAANKTRTVSTATTVSGVASQPRYVVELLPNAEDGVAGGICPLMMFRITAQGVGQDGSEAFVESIYRYRPKRFSNGWCGG